MDQDVSGNEKEQTNSIKHSKIGNLNIDRIKHQDVIGNVNEQTSSIKRSRIGNLDNDSKKP